MEQGVEIKLSGNLVWPKVKITENQNTFVLLPIHLPVNMYFYRVLKCTWPQSKWCAIWAVLLNKHCDEG